MALGETDSRRRSVRHSFEDPSNRNRQPELPLELTEVWSTLPTTKIRRPQPDAPFAWTYTYTAFSLPFASAALNLLGARPDKSVLDPFVESGTTVLAAAGHGCRALGVDVSSFSSLLTRSRLALGADPEHVRFYLN